MIRPAAVHREPPRRARLRRPRSILLGAVAVAAGLSLVAPSVAPAAGAGLPPATAPLTGTRAGAVANDGAANDFGFLPPQPADAVYVRPIINPVIGPAPWTDTYMAPRPNGRHHEGEDLMGHKMQQLVAAVNGTIVDLEWGPGGNAIYLLGDDGWYYNYLHINNDTPGTDDASNQFRYAFAPGMANGVHVTQGQFMAYMGNSGDAENVDPHLHFEIRMPNPHWYQASAVNPKYSLDHAPQGPGPDAFTPFATADGLVRRASLDVLGQPATDVAGPAGRLDRGEIGPDLYIEQLFDQPGSDDLIAPLVRLYLAAFPRVPDNGLRYWMDRVRAGTSLDQVADQFSGTPEFGHRYGTLSDRDFVRKLYADVLHRSPDGRGLAFWSAQLAKGESRGRVVRQLAESDEYRFVMFNPVRVVMIYQALLHRSPDPGGWLYWSNQGNSSATGLQRTIGSIRLSREYHVRITGTP